MTEKNNVAEPAAALSPEATTSAATSNTSNTTPDDAAHAAFRKWVEELKKILVSGSNTETADTSADTPDDAPASATTTTPASNIPVADNALAWMVSARKIELTRSKHGLPCLWESGGGWSNTGEAQLITDKVGNPKRALHIRTRGPLACGEHALVPVQAGDHLVTVKRRWNRVAITVERIASIQEDTATVVPETDPICKAAIDAAITKSRDYHCRRPYYIKED